MKDGNKQALVRALMEGVDRAPKKDKPGLLDDAARIAEAGRYGDKIAAHITPKEAAMLKAMGGSGTINPRTGLMEFFEGSTGADSHGDSSSGMSGADYGGGSAYGGDGAAGAMGYGDNSFGYGVNDPGVSAAPTGVAMGTDAFEGMFGPPSAPAMPSYAQETGIAGRIGNAAMARAQDAMAAPVATGINAIASFSPVGPINSLSGFFGGPTIGGAVTAAGRAMSGYGGAQTASAAPSASGEGGPLGNDTRGGNGGASGDGGALSRPNTALASALMGQPQAGSPANPFGGRKTFGALADSFDPSGRRYVTPWAYRG